MTVFSPYFPRQFFRQILTRALLGALILLLVASISFDAFFDLNVDSKKLIYWFLGVIFISIIAIGYFCYRLSAPLEEIIFKSLRLTDKKPAQGIWDDDTLVADPGDYVELERALEKIRKKLKKRRWQLAHEREESESLMSSLEDAILRVDREGRVSFYNSHFAAQFLMRSQVERALAGQPLKMTEAIRDPEIQEMIRAAFKSESPLQKQVSLRTPFTEQPIHYLARISPVRDRKTGLIGHVLILLHDISELKRAERIRIEFVENASHELRTPLTSIKGFVVTLKEDFASGRLDQAGHFLNIISNSVDRLNELVNDLLTLQSLESSSPLKRQMLDPMIVTQDVLDRLSPLASQKGIRLNMTVEAESFSADVKKVDQVLQNLIGNAIKYVQEGGMIDIRWTQEINAVTLRVTDNGPGISPEHLPRIFERFYRIDKGRSRDVGGTGLGLAIVKHIMQIHGGSVSIRSELGKGSEFVCQFPFSIR